MFHITQLSYGNIYIYIISNRLKFVFWSWWNNWNKSPREFLDINPKPCWIPHEIQKKIPSAERLPHRGLRFLHVRREEAGHGGGHADGHGRQPVGSCGVRVVLMGWLRVMNGGICYIYIYIYIYIHMHVYMYIYIYINRDLYTISGHE